MKLLIKYKSNQELLRKQKTLSLKNYLKIHLKVLLLKCQNHRLKVICLEIKDMLCILSKEHHSMAEEVIFQKANFFEWLDKTFNENDLKEFFIPKKEILLDSHPLFEGKDIMIWDMDISHMKVGWLISTALDIYTLIIIDL